MLKSVTFTNSKDATTGYFIIRGHFFDSEEIRQIFNFLNRSVTLQNCNDKSMDTERHLFRVVWDLFQVS